MKKTRKPIALLLSVLMVLALFAPLSVVSFAEGDEPAVVASGDCGKNGNNMLYTLYSDGTMVLSGSGQMKYYQYAGNAPWKDYRDSIRYLVVQSGVKTISSHAFEYAKTWRASPCRMGLNTSANGRLRAATSWSRSTSQVR